ncbi:uncharacterized protein LOC128956786 [Oppia nitens]|uniref:uncharacterized protein LOC128956786 n=1 Tax=Oppia nitens TaxID=1686743 RepID=UPI0023DCCBAF|nr:uncharacterized protein LOC128956786 [Oppia nitens]
MKQLLLIVSLLTITFVALVCADMIPEPSKQQPYSHLLRKLVRQNRCIEKNLDHINKCLNKTSTHWAFESDQYCCQNWLAYQCIEQLLDKHFDKCSNDDIIYLDNELVEFKSKQEMDICSDVKYNENRMNYRCINRLAKENTVQ